MFNKLAVLKLCCKEAKGPHIPCPTSELTLQNYSVSDFNYRRDISSYINSAVHLIGTDVNKIFFMK